MAAITVDTQREETVGFTEQGIPVKASEVIPAGALTCIDSDGLALNGATTAGLKCAGVAREGFDNTGGANGVLTGFAEARVIRVQRGKCWLFACNGTPKIGKPVWLVDNNTVTTVAGNVFVGWIAQHDGQGGTGWYIYVPGVASAQGAQGAAIVSLTDSTGASGTHDDTLADGLTVTAVTDSTGATADGTIDDVGTAVTGVDGTGSNAASKADVDTRLTAINENFAECASKINTAVTDITTINQNTSDLAQKVLEILTALRNAGIISA